MPRYIFNAISIIKKKRAWRKLNPHNKTVINCNVNIDQIEVGKHTYGYLNVINHSEICKLKIGSFCSLGPDILFVVCGEHDFSVLSSFPYKVRFQGKRYEAISKGDIIVGDDVWIGARAIILSGVTIGQGAVIGAGSIVTKDVPPYSVVSGIPANVVKYRCSKERIEDLIKIDYSKLKDDDIESHIDDLYSPIDIADIAWMPKRRND